MKKPKAIQDAIDAAAMRIAREWARQKGGLPIPDGAKLDDLEDPDFLRALANAALLLGAKSVKLPEQST